MFTISVPKGQRFPNLEMITSDAFDDDERQWASTATKLSFPSFTHLLIVERGLLVDYLADLVVLVASPFYSNIL